MVTAAEQVKALLPAEAIGAGVDTGDSGRRRRIEMPRPCPGTRSRATALAHAPP